ncbi:MULTISPECIES: cbb3-type cytochrome c oxidase subunit 3 [unclassified Phenylobacterium]|jgi:cytochrome c oxidase cbb3-type subunit IV|uniref:cbb3-type cytochrome c oxidase subunit 3 n=1 Tax=unclassified Phenylobacterium TaxID=2640670 RepID=UPI00083B8C4D|nr:MULTISPECIES: cbb3-type cytochrome c oxidase subunit 3 [unclassified Phenylobacterium]MBJ7408920.1 cbb3-type cytochrome c oxidase subunit 3 [Phenylobacterium sp.]
MSGLTYETVATFAQQGGTVFFGLIFAAGVGYALWPRHKQAFQRLAQLPLEDDEAPHV